MEWGRGWRDAIWTDLDRDWDVIIIGGGITGAGILRQCVHAGLKVLLVEAADFASGTSSRSSKLVHGGMRYLKNAQVRVTLESVKERENLLKQGRGLVNRLGFLYPCLESDQMPGWVFGTGLMVYDLMARQWSHRSYDADDMRILCPSLTPAGLKGGFRFFDAQTDDARLVLRLIRESINAGGVALNYARVDGFIRRQDGQVCGVVVKDVSGEVARSIEVKSKVVVNATGAWSDELRAGIGRAPRLRPLRGSHLVFQFSRLPLSRAVTFLHPQDGRPVFVLPWEGAIVYGTTDVDHGRELHVDPVMSEAEISYLLEGLHAVFPDLGLCRADVTAVFSGIRPVVDTGKTNPSKESREHVIWDEDGLLTVSGGKLTTFRIMARQALDAVKHHVGSFPVDPHQPVLDPVPQEAEAMLAESHLPPSQCLRLLARYGLTRSAAICNGANADLEQIPGTPYLWGEVRQAARGEGIIHLDDLMLRRVRLGLLLPRGGLDLLQKIRSIAQPEHGWSDDRWEYEAANYKSLWERAYCI